MTPHLQDGRDLGLFVPSEIDDYGLDVYEFRIYSRLARRAGRGQAWESISNMAAACQMSERKAKEALRVLLGVNLVAKEYRQGQTSIYQLTSKDKWSEPKQLPELRRQILKRSEPRSQGSTEPRSTVPGYVGTGFPGNRPPRSQGSTEPRSLGSTKVLPVEGTPIEGTPTLSVRASKNSASPSEPKQPASTTPPIETHSPANSIPVEPQQVAEDQFSAAAAQQNFSKTEKLRDHFAERCQHPGHKYPQLISLGLGHVWVGPGWSDFLPELVEACCRHLKKIERPHEYGDGQRWLGRRIHEADWAAIELMLQEMQQYRERHLQNPPAIATPAPEPEVLPAQQPALAPEEARSQFLKNAQRLWWAGEASRGIALKSCKTHGFLVDPDTGPYDPELEAFDEWEEVSTEPDPAIAAQIRESLGFQRPAPLFVNPCTELGDWEEAV